MNGAVTPALLDALASIVGPAHLLRAGEGDADRYGEDWRGLVRHAPALVVRPNGTAEVCAAMKLLASAGVAVVPQGGNTGLCGGAVPAAPGREVVMSLSRMRRIAQVDPQSNSMLVEAGAVLADVQRAAAQAARLFPLSLAAEGSCQIGGNIATNAGGTAVLRYGSMRSLVLGLEVVLADGSVLDLLSDLRKDNTGFDLKQLFIGSEGTLGIVTRARLLLHPAPVQSVTLMGAVSSAGGALSAFERFCASLGSRLAAFEFIDAASMACVGAHVPGARSPFARAHGGYFLAELDDTLGGTNLAGATEGILGSLVEEGLVEDAVVAQSHAQARSLWKIRESITESLRDAGLLMKFDISVQIGRLPSFVRLLETELAASFPQAQLFVFGHLGDGNLHVNVVVPRPDAGQAPAVADRVYSMLHAEGGSFSAEHGVGQLKLPEMARYKPAAQLRLLAGVKALLDPGSLLNPGKLLPP